MIASARTSKPLFSTFTEALHWRAQHQPERPIYGFLLDGETAEARLNYAELDLQARTLGALLQSMGLQGERALLLYPAGLEYIAGFFGCLYAGVTAIPAYPLRSDRMLPRLLSIVADARPKVVLTTARLLSVMRPMLAATEEGKALCWLSTTDLQASLADDWREPAIDGDTLAFLQYTSGSTAKPKGVRLSHFNLVYNSSLISGAYDISSESTGVSWLPPYHDMGLIGQILTPLYMGARMTLMSPGAFLQRPYRWLRAVSAYKATHSGAPNFAYDLCVRKITSQQREPLNLEHWRVAFTGAEPVHQETLDRFTQTFAPCGFRRQSFYPCYGLAEATLMVSCLPRGTLPVIKTLEASALEQNRVVEVPAGCASGRALVSNGKTLPTQQIVIAHPETGRLSQPGEVGEIWVSGPSVAKGYWNSALETTAIFQVYLADTGEGPFLRTGDLGFLDDGELFVTGRLQDLIIILGRKLYPQDIELTVERSHPSLRPGCGAAFSMTVGNEEQLVVAQELEFRQKRELKEIQNAVRKAVAEEHGMQLHAVVLLSPGSIPKTSSGKIQRNLCKRRFLDGVLDVCDDEFRAKLLPLKETSRKQSSNPICRDGKVQV